MAFSYPARLIMQGVCGTRPYKPHNSRLVAELKQSSTKNPCLIALYPQWVCPPSPLFHSDLGVIDMAKGLKNR
jgi:hypothetical protein